MKKTILRLAVLLAGLAGALAQNTTVLGDSTLTNQLPVSFLPTKLYAVTGLNTAAGTQYIQVFNRAKGGPLTVKVAGSLNTALNGYYTGTLASGLLRLPAGGWCITNVSGVWMIGSGPDNFDPWYALTNSVPSGQTVTLTDGSVPPPTMVMVSGWGVTNGLVPIFSFPVFGSSPFYLDFGSYGADLDAITVCSSTTATILTLSDTNTTLQAITKSR